jgi:dTDP-4-amino-4,6-dideoxygalactose transaminase
MGKPAAMKSIMEIANKYGLFVIEDAAEAHGGQIGDKMCGSIAPIGCFSTYAAHIISTVEGGVITTNSRSVAEVLRSLRSHGRVCVCKECVLQKGETNCKKRFDKSTGEDTRFSFMRIGYSSKMNELEAAIGIGNIDSFDDIFEKRQRNLERGIAGIRELDPVLWTIEQDKGEVIGPHALPILLGKDVKKTRSSLSQFLTERGIDSRTMFESMPTQCPGFAFLGHELGDFPNAEYISSRGVHVGIHQDLNEDHMNYIIETLKEFVRT